MFIDKDKYLLNPSGLNNRFHGENLSFEEYVALMHNIILESRPDLNTDKAGLIIESNSPFLYCPDSATSSNQNGVLLVHGLFDSPYYVRDLGAYFKDRGFVVNAILLPGHGTVPGDLLDIRYQEWLKALQYGFDNIARSTQNIYLTGYSLGGVLALYQALKEKNYNIKGIILVAPALKPKSNLKKFIAVHHRLFSWSCERAKWYQLREPTNFTKYNSYPINAGYQAFQILEHVVNLLSVTTLQIPLFVVLSADDETIALNAALSFFIKQPHPKNRLLLYTNDSMTFSDPRITTRPSAFPDSKILNFSHTCLAISPENPVLGAQSQFLDLNHYSDLKPPLHDLYLGAATKTNLEKVFLSRLSYNPDYKNMLQHLDAFLDGLD